MQTYPTEIAAVGMANQWFAVSLRRQRGASERLIRWRNFSSAHVRSLSAVVASTYDLSETEPQTNHFQPPFDAWVRPLGVAARTRSPATHARSHFPPGLGNFPKPFWCFPRVACPSMPSKIISFAAFASAAFFIASREQSGHFPPLFGFLHIGHEYNHGYEVFTEWLLASLPSP